MLLAIDTSSQVGSVALLDRERVVAHRVFGSAGKQGALLGPTLATIAELELARVETYAITIGPGSFTGLRIGLAFLKGVALAYPRPVVPVSTLEVIATQVLIACPKVERVLAVLDARRNEVYARLYSRAVDGAPVPDLRIPEAVYAPDVLLAELNAIDPISGNDRTDCTDGIVLAGDGVEVLAKGRWAAADRSFFTPDARVLGAIAQVRRARGEGFEAATLEPVYLQLSPAEANEGRKV